MASPALYKYLLGNNLAALRDRGMNMNQLFNLYPNVICGILCRFFNFFGPFDGRILLLYRFWESREVQ